MKPLGAKEQLFCAYYSVCRNGREAAAKSGFRRPEQAAHRLLASKAVCDRIAALDETRKRQKADIAAGYARLALGTAADAVRLLFQSDGELPDFDTLDLFLISEIKRPKGGGLEIKFFDRLKALEKLENLLCQSDADTANTLLSAIAQGAAALQTEACDD